jgi:hypothetical protein
MAFEKASTITKYQGHETDTGSTRVQIALLTERINYLTAHLPQADRRRGVPADDPGARPPSLSHCPRPSRGRILRPARFVFSRGTPA